ncbi:MAG: hypothetical protein JNL01_03375 [Bdellovibrionales bacterium]|nr:hypothetical protein [Bdellovibrionales bacterium]
MFVRILRSESGAAQIMGILVLSTAMLTVATAVLQYAQQTTIQQIRQGKYSEARAALSSAIQHVSRIYRSEAACDPALLNDKLSQMRTDGSLISLNAEGGVTETLLWVVGGQTPNTPGNAPLVCAPPAGSNLFDSCTMTCGPPTCRRMDVTINGEVFPVSFGPIVSIPFEGNIAGIPAGTRPDAQRGYSHDAEITAWTSVMGRRIIERAVLVNNCTIPCATALGAAAGICQPFSPGNTISWDWGHAYHTIDSNVRGGDFKSMRSGSGSFGSFASNPQVGPVDLVLFKNYLRSGERDGLMPAGPAPGTADPLAEIADLDLDGRVDERDLGIMEKFLRGYIYSIPTRCSYRTIAGCGGTVAGAGTTDVD